MARFIRKRVLPLLAAGALAVSLSGCSHMLGMDVENKLRPPRGVGEQAEIQKALDSYLRGEKLPGNYLLKYPKTGEHRSSFILEDINGDGEEEALALYLPGEKANAIHLNLLQRIDGQWVSVSDVEGVSTDIDSVTFGDLDGDGRMEVITGWNMYTDLQQMVIYSLASSKLTQRYGETNYNKIVVGDIRKTGHDDLLLLRIQPDDKLVSASLLAEQEGKIVEVGAMELEMPVQRLGGAAVCELTDTVNGVFIDGVTTGDGMITELLCWDGQLLYTPLREHGGAAALTFRSVLIPSLDVDGDGVVEWPRVDTASNADGLQNAAGASSVQAVHFTRWMGWDYAASSTNIKDYSYINLADGYLFHAEKSWDGSVTTVYDGDTHTLELYDTDDHGETRRFLSIRVGSAGQGSERPEEPGFELLTISDNVRYEVSLIKDPPFSLNKEDLLRRIKTLPF